MKNKTSAVETLKKRIENKRAALSRRDEVRRLIADSSLSISGLEGEYRDLGYRLGEISGADHLSDRKARLQAERDRVNEALQEAVTLGDQLRNELRQLEYEIIPGALQATTLADIMPHQRELAELRSTVTRLDGVVREQRAIIQAARDSITEAPDRAGERANILARIAIGEADPQELAYVDASIASEQAAHVASKSEANPVIEQATQTIAGLESKIAEVRGSINVLNEQTPFVLEQYLNSEIERACALYMEHARTVQEAFIRVLAMERLMKRATGHDVRMVMPRLLKLPCPALDEYREQSANPNEPNVLIDADSVYFQASTYLAAEAEIVERMHAEGCTLL